MKLPVIGGRPTGIPAALQAREIGPEDTLPEPEHVHVIVRLRPSS
jgi:hypothetical protein